jgi:hypothetical protein
MEQWYYKVGDEKRGPFSLDELKGEGIMKQTKVRSENMPDWEEAGNREELKVILAAVKPSAINETDEVVPVKPDLRLFFLNKVYNSFIIIGFYLIWIFCNLGAAPKSLTNLVFLIKTIATMYLLYGLKKYLNELDDHKKSNYLIYCSISILFISGIFIFFPEFNSLTLSLIFLVISGTLSLLFMVNLIKIKNDFSGHIKRYGYIQFFCWLASFLLFLLAMGSLVNERMSIGLRLQLYQVGLTASAITGIIPFFILAFLFIKTTKLLKRQA